ncbi:hydrolase [Streptomyces sp. ST2-7A]|uniref:hydrolase n=1 Tax=Streptomyces sp. ST2-7A TaxID=2907214 RepID=UPI001F31DB45|nr:hydrolase [Streptomyces sp. ST2-7A]MCE7078833.1 hydrolase [Streptomyces sp. ST2-7A]
MPAEPIDTTLVLGGPRLVDGRTVDVGLSGGRIRTVGTPGSLAPRPISRRHDPGGGRVVDLTGWLLLPAPVEPHGHHTTALTAPGPPADPAALADGPPPSAARDGGSVLRRVTEAALHHLAHGATAQRAHVPIGGADGAHALDAALRAARSLVGLTDLRLTADAGPLTGRAAADGRALFREAAAMGVDALGGLPDADPDPAGCLDLLVAAAADHDLPLDLHTDAGDPALLDRLATAVAGHRPGVVIGPCAGLARLDPGALSRAADRLAAAGVTVALLPQGPCAPLRSGAGGAEASGGSGGGRSADHPRRVPPDTAPLARLLRTAGVRVIAGSGALRDAANPVGRGDPLEAACQLVSRGGEDPGRAYSAVSDLARAALGLPAVRIEAGFPAELLAVRGDCLPDVLSLAYSRLVVHRGRIVSRTSAVREYCDIGDGAATELPRQSTG